MKRLTSVILAVALALSALGVLGARIYQKEAYGGAAPEIAFAADVLEVPTGADDAALLAGVTATDAEDGDVTASLLVEGVSGRNADGTVQVTYAAFDSDRHVTKATRAVRYTDYTPPRGRQPRPVDLCHRERQHRRRPVRPHQDRADRRQLAGHCRHAHGGAARDQQPRRHGDGARYG